MRNLFSQVAIFVCLLISCRCLHAQYPPSTTNYSTETSNNTSACPSSGTASWCTGNFTGLYDHYALDSAHQYPQPNQNPSASLFEGTPGPGFTISVPPPQNVSQVPFSKLLYQGFSGQINTQIVCHYQPWFSPASGHMNIGMHETQSAVVHQQAGNMIARGCNVVILDWYGGVDANGNTPVMETVAE